MRQSSLFEELLEGELWLKMKRNVNKCPSLCTIRFEDWQYIYNCFMCDKEYAVCESLSELLGFFWTPHWGLQGNGFLVAMGGTSLWFFTHSNIGWNASLFFCFLIFTVCIPVVLSNLFVKLSTYLMDIKRFVWNRTMEFCIYLPVKNACVIVFIEDVPWLKQNIFRYCITAKHQVTFCPSVHCGHNQTSDFFFF